MIPTWLERHRPYCWGLGVEHREALLERFMRGYGLRERPLLKDVHRDLISEIQNVRLLDEVLPMDRFAQTEVVDGRVEVTINAMIARMPLVTDPRRVAHVAAWHESIHVLLDVKRPRHVAPPPSLPLGLDVDASSPILCRPAVWSDQPVPPREFIAEAAGLAAAIADADLRRCNSFLNFLQLAAQGGEMGPIGWRLLDQISAAIGVNVTALRRYFQQHGLCRLSLSGGKARLLGVRRTFRGYECLEPNPAAIRSAA